MDLLKDAAKNINLYEVKAYVRKAQNVAMNLTEMEAKVREATNNEPWGAPTSLMAQIAAGTYNYRDREEILGFVFRRFTEKAANEWRQIYKSLQLLDYLIKNGSERIIDEVRSNLSLIQMLKSFHYIDSKGRDQGINVRNRAKTLIQLLNDDSQIRTERKKARANAKKFGGVSSAAFGGASSISTGHGFEDDDFTNRVYGDGGVYGARYDDPAAAYSNGQSNSNDNFEEYNVGSSRNTARASTKASEVNAVATKGHSSSASASKKQQKQEPDLIGDLLSLDTNSNPAPSSTTQQGQDDDDDDFDDFQAAPSQPQSTNISNNLSSLYQSQQATSAVPQFQNQGQAPNYTPNYAPNYNPPNNAAVSVRQVSSSSNDAFSSLFSSAKSKTQTGSSHPTPQPQPTTTSTSSTATAANSSNSTNGTHNVNKGSEGNGEIDLLSF